MGLPRRAAPSARAPMAVLLVAVILASPLACGAGSPREPEPSPLPASPSAAGRRVVFVALDAADWLTIDPLAREGKLPTFARLKAVGRTGVMVATPPLISPILWTTIATGQHPEDHGVLDFMVDLPDGTQAPITSTHRLAPALWNLFSDGGRRVAFVGWWASWPAEKVQGVMVSDALAPQLARADSRLDAGLVWPEAMTGRVRKQIVTPRALTYADLSAYVPLTRDEFDQAQVAGASSAGRLYDDRVAHLAAVVASSRTYAAVALDLLRSERPDLLAVYLEAIDTVSHLFVKDPRRGPQAIERAYRDADALVRQLAEASAPDTLVVVCSDHGFHPPGAAITEDPSDLAGPATAWHRPYGIVAAATAGALTGRGVTGVEEGPGDVGSITPVDVAPTLLHLVGLAVTSDMPGHVVTPLLPRDAASRDVRRAAPPRFVPSASAAPGARQSTEAMARLQALGYVGAVKTSLARQNLGESLYRRGKLPAAERELRAVLEAQPTNLAAMLWLAKALEGQKRTGEALRVYERAVGQPGGAREALVEAVDLALSAREPDRARSLLAAARTPRDAAAALAVAKGSVAEAAGQPAAAEQSYRAALKADPQSFDAAARLLELLVRTGRAGEAIAPLTAALRLAPDSARHQALLGEAKLATRDAAGAEAALSRALALAPDGDLVRLALARAQVMQQQPEKALATLSAAPATPARDTLRGVAYGSLGRWREAAVSLQAAVDAGSATPEVLNGLGWAQMKLGRRDEALAAFRRSLDLKSDQPDIRKVVGDLRAAAPAASSR